MAAITCHQCKKQFDTFHTELKVTSYICPYCGVDNRPKEPETTKPIPMQNNEPVMPEQQTPNEEAKKEQPSQSPQKRRSEWEANWKINPFSAYLKTFKQIITNPIDYFESILPFDDYLSLAVFVYINSFIGVLFSMFYQFTFGLFFHPIHILGLPYMFCGIIFAPIILVAFTFLLGGLLHLFFGLIGGSQKNYNTTITVYGLGTVTSIFGIMPFIGGFIELVYKVIINIWGQAKAHEISVSRAALSFLLPLFVFICCILTFFLVIALFAGGVGVFLESLSKI